MKHHNQKSSVCVCVGRGVFGLCFHLKVHYQRKPAQEFKQASNLRTGTDEEVMEGCYLQVCSPWFAKPLTYRTQNHQSRDDIMHNSMVPSCINHQLLTCHTGSNLWRSLLNQGYFLSDDSISLRYNTWIHVLWMDGFRIEV